MRTPVQILESVLPQSRTFPLQEPGSIHIFFKKSAGGWKSSQHFHELGPSFSKTNQQLFSCDESRKRLLVASFKIQRGRKSRGDS